MSTNNSLTSLQSNAAPMSLSAVKSMKKEAKMLRLIKMGIWAYFFLLMFEGALRKWVFPSLSMPLLIVRDPLALWLVLATWHQGLFPKNIYVTSMVFLASVGILTTVVLGHGNPIVAVYGARILMFHFPLMFVFAGVFDRDDIVKMGKVTLVIAIPMTALIALQFYSPESAYVNKGIGGDLDGGGFAGAMNFLRPPGTFSFTNGVTLFYSLVGVFVFYFWLNPKGVNRTILIGATLGLMASIPISISRGLFFQIALTLVFTVLAVSRKPKYMSKMMLGAVGVLIALAFLSRTSFFQTALGAFDSRFETANEVEGGLKGVLIDRYMGGMIGALAESSQQPFFGFGLGMGTNVGSMLLTGKQVFLIAEGEWGRLIGEMGPLMGLSVILIRVSLTAKIGLGCYRKLQKGDLLPWLLTSFGLMNLAQGGWAQPTSLGFGTLIGGMMLASLRTPKPKQD